MYFAYFSWANTILMANTSFGAALERLSQLCNTLPALLSEIDPDDFSLRPKPHKWSKKEILGHLVDSATNNHQRFIRAQFEEMPKILYDQDSWNQYSFYNEADVEQLIAFWAQYNLHLVALVRRIPYQNLQRCCRFEAESPISLELIFIDYVSHLEHHLKQILNNL